MLSNYFGWFKLRKVVSLAITVLFILNSISLAAPLPKSLEPCTLRVMAAGQRYLEKGIGANEHRDKWEPGGGRRRPLAASLSSRTVHDLIQALTNTTKSTSTTQPLIDAELDTSDKGSSAGMQQFAQQLHALEDTILANASTEDVILDESDNNVAIAKGLADLIEEYMTLDNLTGPTSLTKGFLIDHSLCRLSQNKVVRRQLIPIASFLDPHDPVSSIPQAIIVTVLGRFAQTDEEVKDFLQAICDESAMGLIFMNETAKIKARQALDRTDPLEVVPSQQEDLSVISDTATPPQPTSNEKQFTWDSAEKVLDGYTIISRMVERRKDEATLVAPLDEGHNGGGEAFTKSGIVDIVVLGELLESLSEYAAGTDAWDITYSSMAAANFRKVFRKFATKITSTKAVSTDTLEKGSSAEIRQFAQQLHVLEDTILVNASLDELASSVAVVIDGLKDLIEKYMTLDNLTAGPTALAKELVINYSLCRLSQNKVVRRQLIPIASFLNPHDLVSSIPQAIIVTVLGRFAQTDEEVKDFLQAICDESAMGLIFMNEAAKIKAKQALDRRDPLEAVPSQQEVLSVISDTAAPSSADTLEKGSSAGKLDLDNVTTLIKSNLTEAIKAARQAKDTETETILVHSQLSAWLSKEQVDGMVAINLESIPEDQRAVFERYLRIGSEQHTALEESMGCKVRLLTDSEVASYRGKLIIVSHEKVTGYEGERYLMIPEARANSSLHLPIVPCIGIAKLFLTVEEDTVDSIVIALNSNNFYRSLFGKSANRQDIEKFLEDGIYELPVPKYNYEGTEDKQRAALAALIAA